MLTSLKKTYSTARFFGQDWFGFTIGIWKETSEEFGMHKDSLQMGSRRNVCM